MRDVFRLAIHHGTNGPVKYERESDVAGYAAVGEHVVCFPGERSVYVERVIHDIDEGTTYAMLNGIIYDDAEQYVNDVRWLREHGWEVVL